MDISHLRLSIPIELKGSDPAVSGPCLEYLNQEMMRACDDF
jgi:hypothetical protein